MSALLFIMLSFILVPLMIIANLLKQPKYGLVQKRRRRR